MKTHEIPPAKLDVEVLVADLLGINPGDLASLVPTDARREDGALAGLTAFMRRVLQVAITLSARREVTLRIIDGRTPDAKIANLSTLLAWSLMQARRRQGGRSHARLEPASGAVDPPVRIGRRLRRMPIDELVAELQMPLAPNARDETGESATLQAPVAAIILSVLRLDPRDLRLYRTEEDAAPMSSPEVDASIGLEYLVRDVLGFYEVMRERRTTCVRLMSDDDANDARIPTRAAHLAALLAGALHADGRHEVFFVAPRTRSVEEHAMLRETAKLVYRDFTEEALRGFELLCDGCVHFGHADEWTIAEKLLFEVAPSCDPHLQRMPYCVSAQLAIGSLSEMV